MLVAVFFAEHLDALLVVCAACSVMSGRAAITAANGALSWGIGRGGICHGDSS